MLKIALRVAWEFSRHIKQHVHKVTPYKYLLEHSPPSWSSCQIKTNNVGLILDRSYFFENVRSKTFSLSLNAQNFYKLTKVLILLLNPEFFKQRKFNTGINQFCKHICFNYLDYKYSELYEEEIIIRYVQIFEASKYILQEKYKLSCNFLLVLLNQNAQLQRTLQKMTNAYYETEQSLTELDLYKRNRVTKKDPSIYTYPSSLIRLIDKEHTYNSTYNTQYRRNSDQIYINKHDYTKHFRVKESMREELLRNYKNDQPYIQNTKISRLDLFTGLNYILNRQFYSDKLLQNFQVFMEEYDELYKEQGRQVDAVQFLESMTLCKLFQNLLLNPHIIPEQFHLKIKSNYYKKYSEKYVSYLQKIQFKSLFQLLTHTSNLFPKHAPMIVDSSIEPSRIKNAFKKMCQQILDYQNNGQLIIESFNLNSILELVYAHFDKNDEEWIIKIMLKYQKLLYLWSNNTKKTERRSKSTIIYLLMVKYGLKSDLIAEHFYSFLEKDAWISQERANDKNNSKQMSLYLTFNNLFLYFLYLEVAETPSEQSEEIQRVLLSKIVNMRSFLEDMQYIQEKVEKTAKNNKNNVRYILQQTGLQMNTSIKQFHKQIQAEPNQYNENLVVNIYKVLMILSKAYQLISLNKAKAQIVSQDILEDIFLLSYNLIKNIIQTQKMISYPQILNYLCQISILIKDVQVKAQIYRQITEISTYIRNMISFNNKVSTSKIVIYNQALMLDYKSLLNNLQSHRKISLKKYLSQVHYDQQLEQYAKVLKQQLTTAGYFDENGCIIKASETQNLEQLEKKLEEYLEKQEKSDMQEQFKDEEVIKEIVQLIKAHLFQKKSIEYKDHTLAELAKKIFVLVKHKVLESEKAQKRQANSETQISGTLESQTKIQDNIIDKILEQIDIHKRKAIVKAKATKAKKEMFKKPLFSSRVKLIDKTDTVKKIFKNRLKTQVEAASRAKEQSKSKVQATPTKDEHSATVANIQDPKKILKMMKQKLGKARSKQPHKHLFSKKK